LPQLELVGCTCSSVEKVPEEIIKLIYSGEIPASGFCYEGLELLKPPGPNFYASTDRGLSFSVIGPNPSDCDVKHHPPPEGIPPVDIPPIKTPNK
jgi:hypothetical protein